MSSRFNSILCSDFRSDLKGESVIFLIKNGDEIHQDDPKALAKLRTQSVLLFQFSKEPLDLFPSCLFFNDGVVDRFQPLLCPVETLNQPVIPFLVLCLVKGCVDVFADALLHQFHYHIQLFLEFRLLHIQDGGVVERDLDGVEVGDDLVFFWWSIGESNP